MIRGLLLLLLLLLICFHSTGAQIGELASVFTNLLGTAGSGAAAGGEGAAGVLGSIGPLYQLAQTALQLTGTGVGILNQASEGRWFSDLTNNLVSNQRDLQDRLLSQGASPEQLPVTSPLLFNRASGGFNRIGGESNSNNIREESEELSGSEVSQLGKSFQAPDPEDYEDKKPDTDGSLIRIDKFALTLPPSTAEPHITLFPDEETEELQHHGQKPSRTHKEKEQTQQSQKSDIDYYDETKKDVKEDFATDSEPASENAKPDDNSKVLKRGKPGVALLVELIRNSDLDESQVAELLSELNKTSNVAQQKGDKHIPEPISVTPSPLKVILTTSQEPRILKHRHQKTVSSENSEDYDLLGHRHNKVDISVRAVPNIEVKEVPVIPKSTTDRPSRFSKYPYRTGPPPRAHKPEEEIISFRPAKSKEVSNTVLKPELVQQQQQQFLKLPQQAPELPTLATVQPWYTAASLWTHPSPANLWTQPTPAPIPNLFSSVNQQNAATVYTPSSNIFAQPNTLPSVIQFNPPNSFLLSAPSAQQFPSFYSSQQAQPSLFPQTVHSFQPQHGFVIPQQTLSWNSG